MNKFKTWLLRGSSLFIHQIWLEYALDHARLVPVSALAHQGQLQPGARSGRVRTTTASNCVFLWTMLPSCWFETVNQLFSQAFPLAEHQRSCRLDWENYTHIWLWGILLPIDFTSVTRNSVKFLWYPCASCRAPVRTSRDCCSLDLEPARTAALWILNQQGLLFSGSCLLEIHASVGLHASAGLGYCALYQKTCSFLDSMDCQASFC